MAYVKMVNSVFLQRIQLFKLKVYFAVFASMVWGLSALKKDIYFRFCGDDCWLHQRSTSTINTIILGLCRVVFYDGSNWLITMRGEGGLQKGKSTDFRLSELGISQIAFTALLVLRVLIAN